MAALHSQCFATPRPWSSVEFGQLVASPHVFALAEDGAFLLGRVVAGEAELLTVAVAPDQRCHGRGGRLVAAFLKEARARQAESAFLEVAEGNGPAGRLYARHGFRPMGRRKGYYRAADGTTQDALILVCSLIEPR